MKKVILIFIVLIFATSFIYSQEKNQKKVEMVKDLFIVKKAELVPKEVKHGFDSIKKRDVASYLRFLSSDLMEGRDTGKRGYKIASEFVATMFQKWGIKPAGDIERSPRSRFFFNDTLKKKAPQKSFFQNIILKEYLDIQTVIKIQKKEGTSTKIYTYFGGSGFSVYSRENVKLNGGVVFVGYGIDEKKLKFNEYKGIDVRGKFVLMFRDIPQGMETDSPFKKGDLKDKYYPQRRSRDGFSKYKLAKKKGALGIILIDDTVLKDEIKEEYPYDEQPIYPEKRRSISLVKVSDDMPWNTILRINVSDEIANRILSLFTIKKLSSLKKRIDKDLKPSSFELNGVSFTFENTVKYKLIKSSNVLGYIEGSDPKLKDEVIVIGAHLDHLGKRGDYIFNGADDNASGSVGVMEIAEAFAVNEVKPKRSVLFALWTGEEKGLLGSRYYVANPFFPLKKTVCCLNLDMISRNYTKSGLKRIAAGMFKIKDIDKIINKIDIKKFMIPSVDESAIQLFDSIKDSNKYVGLHIYLRKSKGGMGGSDHASFSMKNVPWAFFMAGFTKDYHQPSDTMDKVDINLIKDISRITYLTAFFMANK